MTSLTPLLWLDLPVLQKDCEPFGVLYEFAGKWIKSRKRWLDGPFGELDADTLLAEVDEFWRESYKMAKSYQVLLRNVIMSSCLFLLFFT